MTWWGNGEKVLLVVGEGDICACFDEKNGKVLVSPLRGYMQRVEVAVLLHTAVRVAALGFGLDCIRGNVRVSCVCEIEVGRRRSLALMISNTSLPSYPNILAFRSDRFACRMFRMICKSQPGNCAARDELRRKVPSPR